ncbi:Centrosomal protein poc5 [Geranomyces variabilis]|uniref:Centrosomal protein POC5 n=1 Tax=Geranomyces variabilis TaxID=109894 RepID=A0AAD5TEP8_9FUNG|nr:Centrosomal protein poc5 [Geranomyces variabilis]
MSSRASSQYPLTDLLDHDEALAQLEADASTLSERVFDLATDPEFVEKVAAIGEIEEDDNAAAAAANNESDDDDGFDERFTRRKVVSDRGGREGAFTPEVVQVQRLQDDRREPPLPVKKAATTGSLRTSANSSPGRGRSGFVAHHGKRDTSSRTTQPLSRSESTPLSSPRKTAAKNHGAQSSQTPLPATAFAAYADKDPSAQNGLNEEAQLFGNSVDKWTGLMRRAIFGDFLEAQGNMQRRQSKAIADANEQVKDEIRQLRDQLDASTAENKNCAQRAVKAERLMGRMLVYLARKRIASTQGLFFARWRLRYADTHRARLSTRIASTHHTRHLTRRILHAWKELAGTSWRKTVERRVKMEAEKAMEALASNYDKRIEQLDDKLADAHSRLHESERARAAQAEELKKAFMRGVCALNMEAMSMFRPPLVGDAHNVPPPLPTADEYDPPAPAAAQSQSARYEKYDPPPPPPPLQPRHSEQQPLEPSRDAYKGLVASTPLLFGVTKGANRPATTTAVSAGAHSACADGNGGVSKGIGKSGHQARGAAFVTRHNPPRQDAAATAVRASGVLAYPHR